jgi:NH3-dependent NAD+ synthetase
VLALAEYLGVPGEIMEKPSNPDIIPGISDKYEFLAGLSSEKVDLVLYGILNDMDPEKIAQHLDVDRKKVDSIIEKVRKVRKVQNLSHPEPIYQPFFDHQLAERLILQYFLKHCKNIV